MPDEVITEAGRRVIDVGVIGAVCVLLIAALSFMIYIYRKDTHAEREAHEVTRKEYLNDVKLFAQAGESMRSTAQSMVASNAAVIEILKSGRDK